MRAFRHSLGMLLTFWASPALAEETIWEHGKACADTLGVEVPRFNCRDGAEIPVTRNGIRVVEPGSAPDCDNPSFGSSGCRAGSRLLQFVDRFQRNGRSERVVTTILCRGSGTEFGDVAIVQHNETNNKVCWFNRLALQQGTNVPPPFTQRTPADGNVEAERYWGKHPTGLQCTTCHDSGPYLRSPWIMQLSGSREGAYERDGATGAYRNGGQISFSERVQRRGHACSVGRKHSAWNARLPKLIKINRRAFEARFPWLAASGTAPGADTCTRCHYLGSGNPVPPETESTTCAMAQNGVGNGRNSRQSARARTFPHAFWMPPDAAAAHANVADFRREYRSALAALDFCCNTGNADATVLLGGRIVPICRGTFANEPVDPMKPCDEPPDRPAGPAAPNH